MELKQQIEQLAEREYPIPTVGDERTSFIKGGQAVLDSIDWEEKTMINLVLYIRTNTEKNISFDKIKERLRLDIKLKTNF